MDRTGRSAAVLRLRAVSRRYGSTQALAPISLTVAAGTVTLVAGANGSGKSTLLRLAAGLLVPSSGARVLAGRARYLPAGAGARAAQTARSAIRVAAGLAGLPDPHARAAAALAEVELTALADRPAGTLSAGQRARLTLALALACPAELVCLDEPTAHLDADGTELVTRLLARLRGTGTAVLVATHDPALLRWPADGRIDLVLGRLVDPVPDPAREVGAWR
ncbi:MAG: ATP-binding cassette domain-containing protein [Actinobacteria bacterium]|nr:ATP-binding cassette domain-containing protein [Actinomycetota bacterium]MBI3686563.1 ATP-binding cassette domain-containing protein [Actinomycetota bacterium]